LRKELPNLVMILIASSYPSDPAFALHFPPFKQISVAPSICRLCRHLGIQSPSHGRTRGTQWRRRRSGTLGRRLCRRHHWLGLDVTSQFL
jgi:hypothetical protein